MKTTTKKLLQNYAAIMRELRERGILRSSNNPAADYAEYVACKKLHLSLAPKITKSYDAIDQRGKKYQIKSRRLTKENSTRVLGVIRYLESANFHFLVAIIFNEDFSVKEVWKIPKNEVKKKAKFSRHQNGYILDLRRIPSRNFLVKNLS